MGEVRCDNAPLFFVYGRLTRNPYERPAVCRMVRRFLNIVRTSIVDMLIMIF
jgi:hypothetical protein